MRSTRPASGDPSPCHAPRESHGGSDENETRKRRAGGPQNCGRQDAQNLHLPTNFSYERHRVTEEHAKRTYVQKSGSSSTSVPAPRGELSRNSVLYLVYTIAIEVVSVGNYEKAAASVPSLVPAQIPVKNYTRSTLWGQRLEI